MKRILRQWLPDSHSIGRNRWLKPFSGRLLHPRLWHLNRHSVAGGVAVGLFCGLIPGPFQMLGAALAAVLWRVNLPLALAVTLYSNPFTIIPLYLAAWALGNWVLQLSGHGIAGAAVFREAPSLDGYNLMEWGAALAQWAMSLGEPLALGLVLLATLLATGGYSLTRAAWRWHLLRSWRRRARHRQLAKVQC